MRDIVRLSDLRASDVSEVGAKAASLGELIHAGMPVPEGFCLTTSVYDRIVTPAAKEILASASAEESADALRSTVGAVELPDSLLAAMRAAFYELCPGDASVAVRSSGTSEDTVETTFAGQYHTELGVRTFDGLIAAVRVCWASLWTEHAIRYREHAGIAHTEASMAVVVQDTAPAESAGVMFVTHPVVIESGWGLGEAVVGGLITPDRFAVSRPDLRVESSEPGHKPLMVVPADVGTTVVDVVPEQQRAVSLTSPQAVELARLGLAIEAHFGCAQDVEWAMYGDRVAILQARPLTREVTARYNPGWDSPVQGAEWARISICDSWLPEPLSPLFATTLFPRLVERWKQNWSTPDTGHLLADPMAGTINGYAYIRLDSSLNKHPIKTAKLISSFFRFHLSRLERYWRTSVLPRHTDRLTALSSLDLAALPTEELQAIIDEAEDLSARYWALLGGLAWYWNGGEWLLTKAFTRLVGPDAVGEGFAVLLQGYLTKTTETDIALHRLANDGDGVGFSDFLAEHGHQVYQLDFVEPTPAEDPSAFLATAQAYRAGTAQNPALRLSMLAARRDAAWAQIESALRRHPVRRALLRALLIWNRRYALVRDQALYHFTLGWPTIRRGYIELGRRLVDYGTLRAPEDVFYLAGDELAAELASDGTRNWDDTVNSRRKLRDRQKGLVPPARVPEGVRVDVAGVNFLPIAFLGRGDAEGCIDGLSGVAVSPGRVTGPARLVASVRDFDKLREGEVLVAAYITPAWSPLLGIAGAVVTDAGGALSHGSIVAREYGIPAVMGTSDATKRIRDGQVITVDGTRGLVSLVDRSES